MGAGSASLIDGLSVAERLAYARLLARLLGHPISILLLLAGALLAAAALRGGNPDARGMDSVDATKEPTVIVSDP